MKKKLLMAAMLAAALVAVPAVAGAASGSPGITNRKPTPAGGGGGSSYSYSGSGSSGSSGSASAGTTERVGTGTGAAVSQGATVEVNGNGAKVTVTAKTTETDGRVIALTGGNISGNTVQNDSVNISIATGAAETAGLPDGVTKTIEALNNSTDVNSILPGLGLEGYQSYGGTRAVIAKNSANQDAATTVTFYVNPMPTGGNVSVVLFDNVTGRWKVVSDVAVDASTQTVSFAVNGSSTVQIIAK